MSDCIAPDKIIRIDDEDLDYVQMCVYLVYVKTFKKDCGNKIERRLMIWWDAFNKHTNNEK